MTDDIEDIMNNFDFVKVHRVMEFLDWKWVAWTSVDELLPWDSAEESGVPSVDKLRKTARRLLEYCSRMGDSFGCQAAGGFKATKWDGALSLEFVLCDWDAAE